VCVATVATREDIAQHTRSFRCKKTSSRVTLSAEDEACYHVFRTDMFEHIGYLVWDDKDERKIDKSL